MDVTYIVKLMLFSFRYEEKIFLNIICKTKFCVDRLIKRLIASKEHRFCIVSEGSKMLNLNKKDYD